MAEDPQPQTLQQRIAMLNASQVGRIPGNPPLPRPKPLLPAKRPNDVLRQYSVNNPPASAIVSHTIHNEPNGLQTDQARPPPPKAKAIPPALPARRPSETPALPPRRPSEQLTKRDSFESTSSMTSAISHLSLSNGMNSSNSKSNEPVNRIKAPAWGDATVPPLPSKQTPAQQCNNINEKPKNIVRAPSDTSIVVPRGNTTQPEPATILKSKPNLPPRLPPRKSAEIPRREAENPSHTSEASVHQPNSSHPSALSFGMNKEIKTPSPPINRPHTSPPQPPPVPLASRPDVSKIQATKPTALSPLQSVSQSPCMLCRDFSGPDSHATRFPRQSLPQQSPVPYLAQQLTSPFPSPTDKARAIFTWLHHNILYDVQSFFAGTIRPSTPASTISSGLAVCEGFAGLFTALATHAGLESVVISGHGKGFGFSNLAPGQPIPPFQGNHAWNAVKIDDGEWKLIDSCWGAGHVQGAGMPYAQKFDPNHFTMSNEEFGIRHFPSDRTQFYGHPMTWEEYIVINPAFWPGLVEPPTIFSDAMEHHGLGSKTVLPAGKKINVRQQGSVRFQWGLFCPHATLEQHVKKGPPFVYILAIHGVDGRKDDFVPLQHVRGQNPGGGGDIWYADLEIQQLGAPGQSVTLFAVTSFGQRKGEACRGLTVREFIDGKGRTAMGFQGVVGWELI